jgi:hypothetical protein
MTISPVTFVASAPIVAVQKVERVKRRPKSAADDEVESVSSESSPEPMYAASSAEEFASDATRDALLNIRLGG